MTSEVKTKTDWEKVFEALLSTIEQSPCRRMECQIETGMKNLRRNHKKGAVSNEDFTRILSQLWIPVKDVRGVILHFAAFKTEYETDLERFYKANKENVAIIQMQEKEIERLEKIIESASFSSKDIKGAKE